jgi:secreted Zn-dependent insulinase-like peptidase
VVEGYHEKLMSLTEKIVEKIVNFQMKEDRFAFVKVRSSVHNSLTFFREMFSIKVR